MVMEGIQKDIQRITKALEPQVETIRDILTPPLPLRIHYQREGIRQLQEAIDLYKRSEAQLNKVAQARLNELLILRERMVRRLAEMRPRLEE